jgi:hypothetical protein
MDGDDWWHKVDDNGKYPKNKDLGPDAENMSDGGIMSNPTSPKNMKDKTKIGS